MSEADMLKAIAKPGPLLDRDGEPLFSEAWQAQILAMATAMVDKGRFNTEDWSTTLGAEISKTLAAGAPDDTTTYYKCVLATFETLVKKAELASAAELKARKLQWIDAYEHTPHGQPVVLRKPSLPEGGFGGMGDIGGFGGGDCGGGGSC